MSTVVPDGDSLLPPAAVRSVMTTVEYGLGPEASAEVRTLYGTYGWWDDRTDDDVREALDETDVVVGIRDDETGELVASARVLTDYTFYAMVFDVVVRADRRGEGLGRELMAAVVAHPALADVAPTLLAREGLVEFYESCGFEVATPVAHPDGEPEALRFMAYDRRE